MKTTVNPHAAFYALLQKMPYETKESIVYRYSGGTSLSGLYNNNRKSYHKMLSDMRKEVMQPSGNDPLSREKMDHMRKRVIASIAAWFKLKKQYQDITYTERLEKIKGTAAKAKGAAFNDLTYAQLRRILSEFNEKQRTATAVNNITGVLDFGQN